ncbi:MAG: enoyl-CoA hydratase, partial [Gammaproteobacteria bacterium]|nr:enoyl-CoA hydratase [Gammaproteobacteria bacterium]
MSDLIESFDDGVLTLTMNRPKARNAMSGPMMMAMKEAVWRAADDPKVRCLVLTGAGGAFCAGGDVKGFAADAGGNKQGSSEPVSYETKVQGLRQGMELSRQL